MKHQVHGTNAEHRLVGVITIDHRCFNMVNFFGCIECRFVVLFDVFHSLDKETSASHGWVADVILWGWLHHFNYHTYDMAGCAKLAVGARSCHLAKNVLIHIAHGVAIVHVQRVHTVHNLG